MKLKNKYTFIFSCIMIALTIKANAQLSTQKLTTNWVFRQQKNQTWYPAKVPGEVHVDLLSNKLIPDPFYRDNEKKVQWVEKVNWEYKTSFDVAVQTLVSNHIHLVFDGLDTYADVYLNGKLILKADNMFRQWSVPIEKIVKQKGNVLLVKFSAAQNKVDSIAKANLPFFIPDNPRAYVRKAQFHFGWDWGPKLAGCGIWKEVRLEIF